MPKPTLTIETLREEARKFAEAESKHPEPTIYGVTDGKAIGTYLEHKFQQHPEAGYIHAPGNSALGIDFPGLEIDMKVTSIKQPQSSCPFKHARQKIYGLGYALLVFVYDKTDDHANKTAKLNILHTIFVEKHRTADFQMTRGLREILKNDGNKDDLITKSENVMSSQYGNRSSYRIRRLRRDDGGGQKKKGKEKMNEEIKRHLAHLNAELDKLDKRAKDRQKQAEQDAKRREAIQKEKRRLGFLLLRNVPAAVQMAVRYPDGTKGAQFNGQRGTILEVHQSWAAVDFGGERWNIPITHLKPADRQQGVVIQF